MLLRSGLDGVGQAGLIGQGVLGGHIQTDEVFILFLYVLAIAHIDSLAPELPRHLLFASLGQGRSRERTPDDVRDGHGDSH